MVVDPTTGDILAYVGSRDYFDEEDKGAIDYVQAKRSPGSALKPFIYALGLQQGRFTAASELADLPLEIQTEGRSAYLPENINHGFLGPMLLRKALGNSRNIPALRVLSEVGIDPTLKLLSEGGVSDVSFEPDRYGLELAIGNIGVSLQELVGLYGMLASAGESLPLRHFADEARADRRRLLRPDVAQLMTNILADRRARQPSFPVGSPLDFDYAVAIKTGTSQGYRDSWALAYSDRLLVGVWVGNPDGIRMDHVTGGSGAAPVTHAILDAVMPLRDPTRAVATHFPPPASARPHTVCALTGKLAGPHCPHTQVEYFLPGTEPTETCTAHAQVRLDKRNGLLAGASCPRASPRRPRGWCFPTPTRPGRGSSTWRSRPSRRAPSARGPESGAEQEETPHISIESPRDRARFLWDPETPSEAGTLRLSAEVSPPEGEIVWIVDGVPLVKVGYPFEARWPLSPGPHTIAAAMVQRQEMSQPVRVFVQK